MTDRPPNEDPQLSALLRTLARDVPDDGFGARLHARLVQAEAPRPGGWVGRLREWARAHPLQAGSLAGTGCGAAAFAALLVVWPAARGGAPAAPEARAQRTPHTCAAPAASALASAEVFVVPEGKVALVQLNFAVDHDVESAEFSVLLPEGLAFFSDGETLPERTFRWSAPLGHGDNRIPIAVIGTRTGRHHLTATATIAGEVVVHEVILDVREPA